MCSRAHMHTTHAHTRTHTDTTHAHTGRVMQPGGLVHKALGSTSRYQKPNQQKTPPRVGTREACTSVLFIAIDATQTLMD